MSEPRVRRSHYLPSIHRHLEKHSSHHRGEPSTAEPLNVTGFKCVVSEQFAAELATAEAFTDDRFIAGLVARSNHEGLTKEHISSAICWVREQLSAQANFEVRQNYISDIEEARRSSPLAVVAALCRKNIREAGAAIGLGMTTDVIDRKRQILGLVEDDRYENADKRAAAVRQAQSQMRILVESGIQREINRQRYRNYQEICGPEFTRVVQEYQSGKMTLRALLDNEAYLAGLNKFENELVIPDDYVIEKVDDTGAIGTEIIDARDANTKAAIRRQMKWTVSIEIPKLAEIAQMEIMSSKPVQAEAIKETAGSWERTKAYARSIGVAMAFSGTTWGVATRTGTKVLVGGLVAAHAPAVLGIGASIATGALAGMAAGYVRDRYFVSAERKKQQRIDAAMGAIDNGVVKSAKVLHNDLVDQARDVQQLQADIAAGVDRTAELDNALKKLFTTIAKVRVRLLRASVGNDAPLVYANEAHPATTHAHQKKVGHGVGFGRSHGASHGQPAGHGVGRGTHGQTHENVDPNWKPKVHGERQDYISFGVSNRLEAQHRLMDAFESALAVATSIRQAYPDKVAGWAKDFDRIEKEANDRLDEAQVALDEQMKSNDRWATARAMIISGAGGAIGVLAMDAFGAAWEKIQPMVATLLGDKTEAVIVNGNTDISARFTADGTVSLQKAGVELAETKLPLPEGVTPQDVTLQFENGDVTVYHAASGRELGVLDLAVEKVIEGEVVRPLVTEVNFAVDRPFPFSVDGQSYALTSYSHGMVGVMRMVNGAPQPVGDIFSVVNDALKAKLGDAPEALQFSVTPTPDGAIIKSAIDNSNVIVLHLPKVVEGAPLVGPNIKMTPLTPERVFMPVGADHGMVEYDAAMMGRTDSALAIAGGLKVGLTVEGSFGAIFPKSEIANLYLDEDNSNQPLADQPGYHQYDPANTTDYPDVVLPSISDTAAQINEEQLLATRPERSRAVVPTLTARLGELKRRCKDARDFAAILTSITEAGQPEQSHFSAITTLLEVVRDAKAVLATKDGDLDYAEIDRAFNDNALHNFVAGIDSAEAKRNLGSELAVGYKRQMSALVGQVNFIRTRPGTERTPNQRLTDLRQKQADAAALAMGFAGVAAELGISDPTVTDQARTLNELLDLSIAPLAIFMRVQSNPGLCRAFIKQMQDDGLLNKTDGTFGEATTLKKLKQLAGDLAAYPDGERSLQVLGLLNTKTPKFDKPQRNRIAQIINDLLDGDADYLSKGIVDVPEPAASVKTGAPVATTSQPTAEPAKAPSAAIPDAGAGDVGADSDEGVDMGGDFQF